MKKILSPIVIALLFLSCISDMETTDPIIADTPYFPLDSFVLQEINYLKETQPSIKKIIKYNGELDKVIMDTVNYHHFLNPLMECNINMPNLVGSYSIDSMQHQDTLIIEYNATDEKFSLKQLQLVFFRNELIKIQAHQEKKGFFSQSQQDLIYTVSEGLQIKKEYKTLLLSDTEILINAQFM